MKTTYFYAILIGLLSFACSTQEEVTPEKVTTTTDDPTLPKEETLCTISGPSSVDPSTSQSYTYNPDFTPNDVNWSVQSGDISIASGQGTSNVTLSFGSSFNGGSIYAIGSGNGGVVCSDTYSISKNTSCTPPTSIGVLSLTSGFCKGDDITLLAVLNPFSTPTSGSYNWIIDSRISIISSQGTKSLTITAPPAGSYSISVYHTNDCENATVSSSFIKTFNYSGC
ncbi:MAG: hypothetical protein WBB45_06315 [Cyclobacteriaceae bacterium]